MLTWTPAALTFYTRHCRGLCCDRLATSVANSETGPLPPPPEPGRSPSPGAGANARRCGSACKRHFFCVLRALAGLPRLFFERALPAAVMKPRLVWITGLGGLVVASIAAAFYFPGLKLPDKEQFQLFKAEHIFERYDLVYKRNFGFEKDEQADISYKMPLRFIWGIKPVDYGNALDPSSKGKVEFDPDFEISSQESQKWMLGFCESVRKQPFYKPTLGPLLSNCFMETFKVRIEVNGMFSENGFFVIAGVDGAEVRGRVNRTQSNPLLPGIHISLLDGDFRALPPRGHWGSLCHAH